MNIIIPMQNQWVLFWGQRGELVKIYSIDPGTLFTAPIGTIFDTISAPTDAFGSTNPLNPVWSKARFEIVVGASLHTKSSSRMFAQKATRALERDEIPACEVLVEQARKIAQGAIQREIAALQQQQEVAA